MRRAAGLLLAAAVLVALAGALPAPALLPAAVGLWLITAGAWTVTAVAARRVRIARFVTTPEACEDGAVRLYFEVSRLGRLPVALEVQDAVGGWRPLTSHGGWLELVVGRRGAYRLLPSAARLRDPLGIFQRRLTAGCPEPLLILPAPAPGSDCSISAGAPVGPDEPDGLRPYTPGTPLSRIHWPALARGAGMHARRLAASAELPLVVVDTDGDPGRSALDWVARAATGCILRLVHAGGCRVLLPGDLTATMVTGEAEWRAVHRRLAVLERWSGAGAPLAPGGAFRIAASAVATRKLPPPADLPPGIAPA